MLERIAVGYILNNSPAVTFLEHFSVNTCNDFPLPLSDLARTVIVMFTVKMKQVGRKGVQNSCRSTQWAPSGRSHSPALQSHVL